MRLGFSVFSKKNGFNRTGLVRFEPVFSLVRLIFHKINVIRFDWFFEFKPNRTVNTPSYLHYVTSSVVCTCVTLWRYDQGVVT